MGRRARGRGIATAALRAARRAGEQRDERAHRLAQSVYNAATAPNVPAPEIESPLIVSAHNAARGILAANGLDQDDERLRTDVAAYLVFRWRREILTFDLAGFREWARDAHAEAEAGTPS